MEKSLRGGGSARGGITPFEQPAGRKRAWLAALLGLSSNYPPNDSVVSAGRAEGNYAVGDDA